MPDRHQNRKNASNQTNFINFELKYNENKNVKFFVKVARLMQAYY